MRRARRLAAIAGLFAAFGCVDVVDSTPHAVWVQRPVIAFESTRRAAESECARYGKRAVAQGTLAHRGEAGGGIGRPPSVFVPIEAFACED